MKQPFFLPCLILTHTISFGRQVFKCYLVDNIRSASVTSHYFINTRWTTPPPHYSSVQLSVRSLPLLLSHCLKRSHDCKMKIDHEGIQRTNFLLGVIQACICKNDSQFTASKRIQPWLSPSSARNFVCFWLFCLVVLERLSNKSLNSTEKELWH